MLHGSRGRQAGEDNVTRFGGFVRDGIPWPFSAAVIGNLASFSGYGVLNGTAQGNKSMGESCHSRIVRLVSRNLLGALS